MNLDKRAQANPLRIWVVTLVLIFIASAFYFAFTRVFIAVDNIVTPDINFTTPGGTGYANEKVHQVRNYWMVWPVLLIVSLLLYAIFFSLKQDPNYPYQ